MMWTTELLKVSKDLQTALKQAELQAKAYLNLLVTYTKMGWMLPKNEHKIEELQKEKQS